MSFFNSPSLLCLQSVKGGEQIFKYELTLYNDKSVDSMSTFLTYRKQGLN